MSDNIDRSNWSEADHDAESVGQDLVELATGSQPERTPDLTPDATSKADEGLAAWIKEQGISPVFVRWALLALILLAFVVFALSVLGGSDEDSPPGTDAAPVYPEDEPEDSAVVIWGEDLSANDDGQDTDTPSQGQIAPTSSSTPFSQPAVSLPNGFPSPIAPGGKVVELIDHDPGVIAVVLYPLDRFDRLVAFYTEWLEDEGYTVTRLDTDSVDYPSVWLTGSGGPEGSGRPSINIIAERPEETVRVEVSPGVR